jgi:spermidine synthase
MAVVWHKKKSGVNYEVRSAGRSMRLYTDGVFHSQYNPQQILTGHVWDLLMLPAFFYPENKIQKVLVLGVGGGAALHMLRYFISPEKIVGVELNPVHISVARRFFNLKHPTIELIEADAINWLENYQGEKFDMIIDDLFAEEEGEPVAVVEANRKWFSCMLKHLSKDGVIVRNFLNKEKLLDSAGINNKHISKQFASVYQLTSFYNENFVGVYSKVSVSSSTLRRNLINTPIINPNLKTSKLRYRIRRLG